MSCSNSDASNCRGSHLFGWLLLLAAGTVVIASLPEIRRYIKMSMM